MEIRSIVPGTCEVSALGYGCWGIGGRTAGETSYGETDDDTSLAALNTAIDSGITFFDTAPPYGDGHSERLIGKTIEGRRDRVVIGTKVGIERFTDGYDFSAGAMRQQLEGSLSRLDVASVDIVQLHSPSKSILDADPGILESLHGLKDAGLAKAVGVSVKTPTDGIDAICRFGVDVVQVNLNLMDQRAVGEGLIDAAQGRASLIARTPLCFGFLTGVISDDARFPAGDHRNAWPPEQLKRWIEGTRMFAAEVAGEIGTSPTALALRWCLSVPTVATVIPGMLGADEVVANAAAVAEGPLPETTMGRIAQLYDETEFFVSS